MSQAMHGTPNLFAAKMKPAGKLAIEVEGEDGKPELLNAQGGMVMLKIMGMSDQEKRSVLLGQAHDPLLLWFACLEPRERREMILAANETLQKLVDRHG